jgi:hypothetical protein
VISIRTGIERQVADVVFMSRMADRRLAGVLEEKGSPSDRPAPDPTSKAFELEDFRDFDAFQLFWLGEEFEDLPLTDVTGSAEGTRPVSFLYGGCYVPIGQEGGCALPVEIQIWPACERNLSLYPIAEQVDDLSEIPLDDVRGAPAFTVPEGHVDIYTSDVTIVVFGDAQYLDGVFSELRSVDGEIDPNQSLPTPIEGHLEGKAPCPQSVA